MKKSSLGKKEKEIVILTSEVLSLSLSLSLSLFLFLLPTDLV